MTEPTPRAWCGAKKHQSEGTCQRPAGWGTDHPGYGNCKLHSGSTPAGKTAAARQRVQAEATAALRGMQIEPIDDPLTELAQHVGEVRAMRDVLREEVNRLEELRYKGATGEQIRAELAAYQAALRDTTQALVQYARLNIDERIARIDEKKADRVVAAINAVIDFFGATGQQAAQAREAAVRRLKAVN